MDCIHVFRAVDYDDAFKRALSIGRSHEEEYKNAAGQSVRWRCMRVLTLDQMKSHELDGIEIHSELVTIDDDVHIEFEQSFHPEDSEPVETL